MWRGIFQHAACEGLRLGCFKVDYVMRASLFSDAWVLVAGSKSAGGMASGGWSGETVKVCWDASQSCICSAKMG